MPKYTFTRSAIVQETYFVEAETEQEAWDIIRNNPDQPVVNTEFLDWYTDDFVLEDGDWNIRLYWRPLDKQYLSS